MDLLGGGAPGFGGGAPPGGMMQQYPFPMVLALRSDSFWEYPYCIVAISCIAHNQSNKSMPCTISMEILFSVEI